MGNDMFNDEQLAHAKVMSEPVITCRCPERHVFLGECVLALRLALETATRERDEARANISQRDALLARLDTPPADAATEATMQPSMFGAWLMVPVRPMGTPADAATEAVREAFRVLLSEPGDLDYPVEDVYSEGPDVDGNGDAPFWSEAGLYGRVGKEAARTLLARHRRATEALAALTKADAATEALAPIRGLRISVAEIRAAAGVGAYRI